MTMFSSIGDLMENNKSGIGIGMGDGDGRWGWAMGMVFAFAWTKASTTTKRYLMLNFFNAEYCCDVVNWSFCFSSSPLFFSTYARNTPSTACNSATPGLIIKRT